MNPPNVQEKCNHFFTGQDIYGQLFNYANLCDGNFGLFINKAHFAYDSDVFNLALSKFLFEYDKEGQFCIASLDPDAPDFFFTVENDFDAEMLNSVIEEKNQVLKLVPTYLFDFNLNWAIYFDNDLDAFISWTNLLLTKHFNQFFDDVNDDFYKENNRTVFLDKIINRNSWRVDFEYERYSEAMTHHNI
jgi:hypothetical protein